MHVIEAYTEFQQYLCIIFEDMSTLLSALFIFCSLISLLEAETSEQHRCLVIMIIIPNIGFMVHKTTGLNPVFQRKNTFWKIFTESWDIGKNVSGLFRDFCLKQQKENRILCSVIWFNRKFSTSKFVPSLFQISRSFFRIISQIR